VPSVLRAALVAREWPHRRRFEEVTERPDLAQARLLGSWLRQNADTHFGREHGFATISSPAEYARRVPIRDYEGFRPYVRRIAAREARVLTAESPFMFTTTSGTTGEPKLIPVTASWKEDMASLMRLWLVYALRDHPRLLSQKALTSVSPAVEGHTETGMPFGAMTGVAYQELPWCVRRRHVLPYAVFLVRDYETRYVLTMRLALAQSISSIGTPNPSSLIRLAETASAHAEEIIRAIHDGTLGVPVSALPEPLGGLRPDPERARTLSRIVETHGRLLPRLCWPDLALVACWLGGNAGIHARRLPDYYGVDRALRDLGLLASEGRMTIPLEDHSAAGVLAVHANFFEFIAEDQIEEACPSVWLAHELEEGKRYYLILTGGNGLYRYDLNDVVEVRGFHGRTPKVAFVRKGRDMVSITGEKLHLNQIQAALRRAEERTGLEVWQFRLIPDVDHGRYDLLIERPPSTTPDVRGEAFLSAFDEALSRLNVEYAQKRSSKRLGPPRLFVMRPGWSERQCRAEFRQGRRDNQHKWPAIGHTWDDASRADIAGHVEAGPSGGCSP
jgi:hypothetical protein